MVLRRELMWNETANFYSNAMQGVEFSSHYSAIKNIAFVTGES